MPDEETEGTVAVEDAPIPDEATGQPQGQEQAEPEGQDEAASGAPGEDEEAGQEKKGDPNEVLRERFAAFKETNPDLWKELVSAEPEATPEGKEQELLAREAAAEARERRADWQPQYRAAVQAKNAFAGEALQQQVANAVWPHVEAAQAAFKKAAEEVGVEVKADLDYGSLFNDVFNVVTQAAAAWATYQDQTARAGAYTSLEASGGYAKLTPEERRAVRAHMQKPLADVAGGMPWILHQIGLRAAPEDFKAKTRQELETETGAAEARQKLLEAIGGKAATNGARASSLSIRDMDDADDAYNEGKLSREQYDKYAETFGVDLAAR